MNDVFTIGQKIVYYKKRNKDRSLPIGKRNFAFKRLIQLEALQNRYSILNIPDERMFLHDTKSKQHDYIVAKSRNGYVKVCSVTDSDKVKGYPLEKFNGKSKFSKRIFSADVNKNTIHFKSCYNSITNNAYFTDNDKNLFDAKIK